MNIHCAHTNIITLYTETIEDIFKKQCILFDEKNTMDQIKIYEYLVIEIYKDLIKDKADKNITTKIKEAKGLFNKEDFTNKLSKNKTININDIEQLINIISKNKSPYLSLSLIHYLYKRTIEATSEDALKLITSTIKKITFEIPIYSYMHKIKTEIKKNNPFLNGANYANQLEFYLQTDYIDFNKYQPDELLPLLSQIRNEVIYSNMSERIQRNIVDINGYKFTDDVRSIAKPTTQIQNDIIKIIENKYQYFEMLPFIHFIYKDMINEIDNDTLLNKIYQNLRSYDTSKYINLILVNMQTYKISELKLLNNNTITQENLKNYITKNDHYTNKIINELYYDLSIQIHQQLFKNTKHTYNYLLIRDQIFMTYDTITQLSAITTNNIYYDKLKELAQKITHPQLITGGLKASIKRQKSLYTQFEPIITITNLYNELIETIKDHIDTSQIIEDHKTKIDEMISNDNIDEYQKSIEDQIHNAKNLILKITELRNTMRQMNKKDIEYEGQIINENIINQMTKKPMEFIIANEKSNYNKAIDWINSLISYLIKTNKNPVPVQKPINPPVNPSNPPGNIPPTTQQPAIPPAQTNPPGTSATQPPSNPAVNPSNPPGTPTTQQPSNPAGNTPPTTQQPSNPPGNIPPTTQQPAIPPTQQPGNPASNTPQKSNLIRNTSLIAAVILISSIFTYKYINNDDKSEENYEYEPNFITLTQNPTKPMQQVSNNIQPTEQIYKSIEQNPKKIQKIATTDALLKSIIIENQNIYSMKNNDQHTENDENQYKNEDSTDYEEQYNGEDQYDNEKYNADNEDYNNDDSTDNADEYNEKDSSADEDDDF
jgi:hypothetical protein